MIITLKGANFASSNIGTLDSWLISKSLTGVTIDNTATSVKKGEAYKAVITLKENYTFPDNITVTMGGTDITSTYVTKTATTITIHVPSVTGNIVIRVNAISTSVGAGQYAVSYNLRGIHSNNTTEAIDKNSKYISTLEVLTNSGLTSTPAVSYTITMGGKVLTVDTDYNISDIGFNQRRLTIEKVTGDLVIEAEARYSTPSSVTLEKGKWPSSNQTQGSNIQYYPSITSDNSNLMYMPVPAYVQIYTYMNNVLITGTSEHSAIVLRPAASDYVTEYYTYNNSARSHHFKVYSYETQIYYNSSVLGISYAYPANPNILAKYTIKATPSTALIRVKKSGSSIPVAEGNGNVTVSMPAGTTINYEVSLAGYTSQSETITLTQSGTNSKVVTLVKEETGGGEDGKDVALDLNAYATYIGCIAGSTNTMQGGGTAGTTGKGNMYVQIPLKDFSNPSSVTVTADASVKAYFTFFSRKVASDDNGATPPYASGVTAQTILDTGKSSTVTIPSGATHMYILLTNGTGGSLRPANVTFHNATYVSNSDPSSSNPSGGGSGGGTQTTEKVFDVYWTLGYTISSTGSVGAQPTYALSDEIAVPSGKKLKYTPYSGEQIWMVVGLWNGDTWIERKTFDPATVTSATTIDLGSATKIRIGYGRSSSSNINMDLTSLKHLQLEWI